MDATRERDGPPGRDAGSPAAGECAAFLDRIEKASRVGGFMIDVRSGAMTWTDQTYRIHEMKKDGALSSLGDSFLSADARARLREVICGASDHETGFDFQVPITTAAGRAIWVRVSGAVETCAGVPVRVVGAVQDITRRRLMEPQLREAVWSAQRANEAKSQFLANMSHEIRTPLNAVIGLSYLLERTELDEDQRQLLAKIRFAGRSLLGVINSVLDLSKIEAGEMVLEEQEFELEGLIREVGQMMAPQAAAKGLELIVQPAAQLPQAVVGDATRLQQILINLVNNALKFTESGHVALRARPLETLADRVRLHCEVEDTGIGIEPEALDRLFTPFTQADASTTRRFGGTGLGLSIARRFVELMGGEIGVTSKVGTGSRFFFEITMRRIAATDGACLSARPDDLRITIVSSVGDVPSGVGALARSLGWAPRVLEDLPALLKCLTVEPPRGWPDLLVLDLESGVAASRESVTELSGRLGVAALPPIIVIGDLTDASPESGACERGGEWLLTRPLTSSGLFNAVNSVLATRHDCHERLLHSTMFNESDVHWLAGVRILVADDSSINLEVARRILERQGAQVVTRSDGDAAAEYAIGNWRDLDVVLMDVQMPMLDGNEATRRMSRALEDRMPPVIALTAGALVGERQRSLQAGMSDFISKPFDPQALIRKVRHFVEKTRGEPIPVVVASETSPEGAGRATLPSSVDAGIVQQMFGGDTDLFSSLLARMLAESVDLAEPRRPPEDAAGRTELKRRLHKLKGTAGMIGASPVMRAAAAGESALEQAGSTQTIEAALAQLASALVRLNEEARTFLGQRGESAAAQMQPVEASEAGARLEFLCALLEAQNLAALEEFAAVRSGLGAVLSPQRVNEVGAAIENLEFSVAASLLRSGLTLGRS